MESTPKNWQRSSAKRANITHPAVPSPTPPSDTYSTDDERSIMDLAAELRDHGGFTYDPRTGRLVQIGERDGYAIAIPETEKTVYARRHAGILSELRYFARKHSAALRNYNVYIGGWHSDDRGVDVIELTEILDIPRHEAESLGWARNQEGILDMRTGEFIPTGGTGDVQV